MHYFVSSILVLGGISILAHRVSVDGITSVAMVIVAVNMFYSVPFVLRLRKRPSSATD